VSFSLSRTSAFSVLVGDSVPWYVHSASGFTSVPVFNGDAFVFSVSFSSPTSAFLVFVGDSVPLHSKFDFASDVSEDNAFVFSVSFSRSTLLVFVGDSVPLHCASGFTSASFFLIDGVVFVSPSLSFSLSFSCPAFCGSPVLSTFVQLLTESNFSVTILSESNFSLSFSCPSFSRSPHDSVNSLHCVIDFPSDVSEEDELGFSVSFSLSRTSAFSVFVGDCVPLHSKFDFASDVSKENAFVFSLSFSCPASFVLSHDNASFTSLCCGVPCPHVEFAFVILL